MVYRPRHFAPHELLPGLSGLETWATLDPVQRGHLDDRLIETADEYRDLVLAEFSCVTEVNDYATGGDRCASGHRGPDCTVGKPHSQHREGKAIDAHHTVIDAAYAKARAAAKRTGATDYKADLAGRAAALAMADQIRAAVRRWVAAGKLRHLGGMEIGVTWIHLDVRDRVNGKVAEFNA